MLILSCKLHEEIHVDNGIVITVVAIRGKQVRLAIRAPADVPIRRAELQPLPGGRPPRAARLPVAAAPVGGSDRAGCDD